MLHDSALYKFMIDIDITINDVFSSPTRKLFFCLNPAVSNQNNRVWTGGKKADISMWWSRLACVLVTRDDSTLLTIVLKWILRTTMAVSFPVLSTTALDCCPAKRRASTHSSWLQTNCPYFIVKDQWPPNSPDLNLLDYHVWGQCWRPSTRAIRNRKRSPNWRKSCRWSGTAYLSYQ